jgi:hypothetical protein
VLDPHWWLYVSLAARSKSWAGCCICACLTEYDHPLARLRDATRQEGVKDEHAAVASQPSVRYLLRTAANATQKGRRSSFDIQAPHVMCGDCTDMAVGSAPATGVLGESTLRITVDHGLEASLCFEAAERRRQPDTKPFIFWTESGRQRRPWVSSSAIAVIVLARYSSCTHTTNKDTTECPEQEESSVSWSLSIVPWTKARQFFRSNATPLLECQ